MNSLKNWSGKKVSKKKIKDVNYKSIQYEFKIHKKNVATINRLNATASNKKSLIENSINDIRRFFWYLLGMVYPN